MVIVISCRNKTGKKWSNVKKVRFFSCPTCYSQSRRAHRRTYFIRSYLSFSDARKSLRIFLLIFHVFPVDIKNASCSNACCHCLLSYLTHASSGHPENKHGGFLVACVRSKECTFSRGRNLRGENGVKAKRILKNLRK